MTTDEAALRQEIERYLPRLGQDPNAVVNVRLLGAGVSGASVCLLEGASGNWVLKITLASAGEFVFGRAAREAAFYRELAASVPLKLPRVLGSVADAEAVLLLFQAYRPSVPPGDWPEADWLEAAQQLARFHAQYWDRPGALSRFSWLRTRQFEDRPQHIQEAEAAWARLGASGRFASLLTDTALARISELLHHVPALDASLQAFPLTLCHGDCITDNVLRDEDGGLVWTDWQEVCRARGVEDVSFFLQRASAAGGSPPVGSFLRRYADTLHEHTGEPVSVDDLRRAVDAADLTVRLLFWPYYLEQAEPPRMEAMLNRIHTLAENIQV